MVETRRDEFVPDTSSDGLPSTGIQEAPPGIGEGLGCNGSRVLEPRRLLQAPMQRDRDHRRKRVVRFLVGLILLSCILCVVVDFARDRKIESALVGFLEWTREHTYEGMIAVILCYIVATVCFIPGSLLSFGAGFAIGSSVDTTFMGIALSSGCVFLGASIGSICSFLLGRYLFRDCVLQLAFSYPIFQAIERALETKGLKIMVLLRLSPLIPYNALDYISGVTSISLKHYSIALLAMLPGIIMLCSIGASASSLSDRTASTSNATVKIVTIVSGLLFGGCGVFMASYYSKLELDRILIDQSTGSSALYYVAHELSQNEAEEIAIELGRDEESDEEVVDDNESENEEGRDSEQIHDSWGTAANNATFS